MNTASQGANGDPKGISTAYFNISKVVSKVEEVLLGTFHLHLQKVVFCFLEHKYNPRCCQVWVVIPSGDPCPHNRKQFLEQDRCPERSLTESGPTEAEGPGCLPPLTS